MNGRKRKWKGGQGKENGTDFQIKFSGHLNKHLSQRSNRRGTAGGTCASWAALGAFQRDTSNKQHLKTRSALCPRAFPPRFSLCNSHHVSSSIQSLQAFPVPFCPAVRGMPGWGTLSSRSPGPWHRDGWLCVPGAAVPAELQRRRRGPRTTRCLRPPLLPSQNKRAKGESKNCRAIKNKNESPSMN